VVVWGCVRKCEAGEGLGAKYLKLSCHGLDLGAPSEIKAGGDRERWWGDGFAKHKPDKGI
jgi:hypothetical protein